MSDFTLTPHSPLEGYRREFDRVTIAEVTDRAIVSIATPDGGESALEKAIASAFETKIPPVGESLISSLPDWRLMGMQPGQLFLLFVPDGPEPVKEVAQALGDTACLTDQSDSWVTIAVSGAGSIAALERICPIDLHPSAFRRGAVARTVMEHIAAIIVCEEANKFLLMSPRSSARSFLHALETSVHNIL